VIIDYKGDLLAYSDIILQRWKKTLLSVSVHRVNEIIQTGVHTSELLVPNPSSFPVEVALERLKNIIHEYQ